MKNMFYYLSVVLVTFIILIIVKNNACNTTVNAEEQSHHENSDINDADKESFKPVDPDWSKLEFHKDLNSIKKVTIHLPASYFNKEEYIEVVEDPKILKLLENSFTLTLRIAVSENSDGGVGNVSCGDILCETTRDKFTIGINPNGFVLDSKELTFHNVFYNYVLAKIIDESYYKKYNKHIPDELVDDLSGRSIIDGNIRAWKSFKEKNTAIHRIERSGESRR